MNTKYIKNATKPLKTILCSKVLQLMDKDYDYQKALKIIVIEYNLHEEDARALEEELSQFI